MQINYLIEKYLENILTKKNLSKNTFMSYKNDLQQFQKFFNLNEIENVDEDKIKNYVEFFSQKLFYCVSLQEIILIKKFFYFFRGKKID